MGKERTLERRGRVRWIAVVVMKMVRYDLREEKKRGRWVEIGRDAAALFSDLSFRFLLMHHINGDPAG